MINERRIVVGILIDVKAKAARDRNYAVSKADLEEWVCENGQFPPRFVAIFDLGWSDRYDDLSRYFGGASLLDLLLPAQFSWPGISLGKRI